ncbi:MAG: hypothetical protein GY712_03630 [Oceanicoccus sp.]|uniref:hypothetical protein n=1 Tax=Oceanicoccus sp. TaxID=2691044 RepID=UPI002618147D|nr:hypothetical protein [Oceanicoccus sp.]MCP3907087.1 hypothetical protein [Oceanicoccus sp.]
MRQKIVVLFLSAIFAFATTGCENEGSAEKAGKEIDKAYEKAEKEVNKTIDNLKKKMEETKEKE